MFGNTFPHPLALGFHPNESMAKKTYRAHNAYVMQVSKWSYLPHLSWSSRVCNAKRAIPSDRRPTNAHTQWVLDLLQRLTTIRPTTPECDGIHIPPCGSRIFRAREPDSNPKSTPQILSLCWTRAAMANADKLGKTGAGTRRQSSVKSRCRSPTIRCGDADWDISPMVNNKRSPY